MRGTHRLVVFAEPPFRSAAVLVDAAARAARAREDVEVVAVINTARRPARGPARGAVRYLAADLTHRLFNRSLSVPFHPRWIGGTPWVARRHHLDFIEPPGQDLNAPGFIDHLRTTVRPSLALVFGSLQIFRPALLSSVDRIVNYHNGLVPDYRGLQATAWSIYNGEKETGFTFHDMVPGIDEGPVVLQGSVTVRPGESPRRHEFRKTMRAAELIPTVLARMIEDAAVMPQRGPGAYYSRAATDAVRIISDPTTLSEAELRRRLIAFETLSIAYDGRFLPVSGLARARRPKQRLAFLTSDGIPLQITRLGYLPTPVYFPVARIRAWKRRIGSGR